MLKIISTSIVTATLLLAPAVYADDATTAQTPANASMSQTNDAQSMGMMSPDEKQQMHKKWADKWANMTPEQKADMQKKMAEHWKNATPAQKKAVVEHFVMKFKSLPDEQQKQILDQLKQSVQNQ